MDDFESLVHHATEIPFTGWSFSAIERRWKHHHPPWNYRQRVLNSLGRASSFLDLGTGDGEFVASLFRLPREAYATEGYLPNLPLARRRLQPLGVRVLSADASRHVPLPSGSIDLVTDRHTGFSPSEVGRVLRRAGRFITQQVGAANYGEINSRFGVDPGEGPNDVTSAEGLAAELGTAGLTIVDRREARFLDEFLDVGAVVYYLRAVPWQIPGFSVDAFREPLHRIHSEIARNGRFRVTAHRILLVAAKP